MTIDETIRNFLEDCEVEHGHSPKTIENYGHYLGRFLDFTLEKKIEDPAEITFELVRQWRRKLHRQNLKVATLNYHLIALRSYLKYLTRRDILSLPPEKIELAGQDDRTIDFLEPDELERLFAAVRIETQRGLRDRAILETLFSTGLRVSELVGLDRGEVNLDRGEFGVRGKGGKIRVVFLSEPARGWLVRYFDSRTDTDPAVFARLPKKTQLTAKNPTPGVGYKENDKSLRLTVRQIERIVQAAAKRAGILKKVHPHVLRHTLATDLLQNGADLRSVQEILGHASVTTTQVYTHVTNPRLKEVHEAFHRRQNLETKNRPSLTSGE